ncbi:unnamed protein product, partial [Meganyctiphanes norvegica]
MFLIQKKKHMEMPVQLKEIKNFLKEKSDLKLFSFRSPKANLTLKSALNVTKCHNSFVFGSETNHVTIYWGGLGGGGGICQWLLDHSADPLLTYRDTDGKTAADNARSRNYNDLFSMS